MTSTNTESDALTPVPLVDLQAEYEQNKQQINDAFSSVCASSKFIMGPQVSQLEQALSKYVTSQSKAVKQTETEADTDIETTTTTTTATNINDHEQVQCVCVSDGTAALQLCLMALNIKHGDEVITTPFTWISSGEVIKLVGAKAIFSDIHEDSYQLNIQKLENLITENTKAIIIVSLFGMVSNELMKLRHMLDQYESKYNSKIAIIEDGAQSFGAVDHQGYKSCSSPYITLATTSFFPTKPLGCYGDGGAIFTRNMKLYNSIKSLRVHGKVDGRFQHVGLNSRLDTIQACILLFKLENKFQQYLQNRHTAAQNYIELLKNDHRIILPLPCNDNNEYGCSAWGVFTIRVDKRDQVMKKLKQAQISCAIYYPVPCHLQPMFQDNNNEDHNAEISLQLQISERVCKSVLSLPIHPYLTKDTQLRIVRELCTALDDLEVNTKPI